MTTTTDFEPAATTPTDRSRFARPWDAIGVGALVWAALFGALAVGLSLTPH